MPAPDSREIFGAEIQYFRLEPRAWEPVIRRFKDTGLRCATTYVQWGTHVVAPPDAKHPAGRFDFEGRTNPRLNLRRFLDLIEKHGLLLNFRAGPFCCNEMPYGGQPRWLVCGDPSMMVWDHQNRTTQGYWIGKREGSQPSYLHPRYLELVKHWFAAVDPLVVPRLRRSIGGPGFINMMNLDNEISYIVRDSFLDSDYNPVNVGTHTGPDAGAPARHRGGFYHQFLEEKYGSAKAISSAYGRRIAAFHDVAPPRSVPASLGRDLAWHLDWVEFKQWAMCQYIQRLRGMHEANGIRNDPAGAFRFMTNFNPHLPEGVPTRMPAFEAAVSSKDGEGLVGYDFYRGTFMSYSGYHSMARVLKLMNASVRYTWSAEFMSGTWNLILGSRVSDDHMRFMARCALAQGCKALSWFMFHDRDCWGDTPVSGHGHARPSIEVLTETPRLVFEKIKRWDELVPLTDVGIAYDLIQHRHTAIGDPSPCNDNENHVGKPAVANVEAGKASKEYYGLFRLIEQAGVQPGVVDLVRAAETPGRGGRGKRGGDQAEGSLRKTRLEDFPLMFMPGSPVIERAASGALRRYVAGGGVLVVTGAWPGVDERGSAIRFLGTAAPRAGGGARTLRLGKGLVYWHPNWQAQEDAESESLNAAAWIAKLIVRHAHPPAVHLSLADGPVHWVDWAKAGGAEATDQSRLLASAVLHATPDGEEKALFVLNHYPVAVRFRVRFADRSITQLIDLDSGEAIAVERGVAVVDIDRKAAGVFAVR